MLNAVAGAQLICVAPGKYQLINTLLFLLFCGVISCDTDISISGQGVLDARYKVKELPTLTLRAFWREFPDFLAANADEAALVTLFSKTFGINVGILNYDSISALECSSFMTLNQCMLSTSATIVKSSVKSPNYIFMYVDRDCGIYAIALRESDDVEYNTLLKGIETMTHPMAKIYGGSSGDGMPGKVKVEIDTVLKSQEQVDATRYTPESLESGVWIVVSRDDRITAFCNVVPTGAKSLTIYNFCVRSTELDSALTIRHVIKSVGCGFDVSIAGMTDTLKKVYGLL